ncbi:hypothetical protein K8F61_09645 [Microbacterium resistens]|uniref:Uncharacterized protein n=1 Tax=Microbacterium resistens TaxID=156977 RepID=A0ABY3RQ33_9MICO|nr:hypothetical protein [Microbacterium resistens]UGS24975.1 hypothetical protein K8F61_09645 [Microbacterium resistens]
MDPDTTAALAALISIGLSLLGAFVGALILYFIIRQGVFHGMRRTPGGSTTARTTRSSGSRRTVVIHGLPRHFC